MNFIQMRKFFITALTPITFAKNFKDAIRVADKESYFPEMRRKSRCKRIIENLAWLIMHKEVNDFYNLYGFDIKGLRNQREYIDYYSFMLQRNDRNHIREADSETCLLRDKLLFYVLMSFSKIPVPEVFALVENGKLYGFDEQELDMSPSDCFDNCYIKDRSGECASFVKHISNIQELESLLPSLRGKYIIQKAVKQCDRMNELNPDAINTLRIVTVQGENEPVVLTSLLRVGTKKTGNVDNWAAGGLAIGINSKGYLKKYGLYKPCHGLKAEKHPDTNIQFSDFLVPQFEEAKQLCIKAHKVFNSIHSIGWDVAVTENGPCLIEGNDNWEISMMQACDKPLKAQWEEMLK